MMLSTTEMARARETVARILDDIALDAYLFELEPDDHQWQLNLECAARDGWSRLSVPLDGSTLAQASDDDAAYQRLLAQCDAALGDCKRSED